MATSLAKNIWHPHLPLKVSVFVWKLLHKGIPVDDLIQRREIHFASKCLCYVNPSIERANHLFLQGDLVKQIWKFFASKLGGFGANCNSGIKSTALGVKCTGSEV